MKKLVVVLMLFANMALAEPPAWRSSNIQLLFGNQYELGPATRESITIEHASSWRYGESFFSAISLIAATKALNSMQNSTRA